MGFSPSKRVVNFSIATQLKMTIYSWLRKTRTGASYSPVLSCTIMETKMQDLAALILLVLIPAAVGLILALLGNLISFDNRYINALVSAAVSSIAVAVGTIYWTHLTFKGMIILALFTGGVVFIAGLICNWITFKNRFANAIAKAVVFAVPFAGVVYYLYPLLQVS